MKINDVYYKLDSNNNKRIILLSDIHYFNKKIIPNLYVLLEHINKLKPNYICIAGDIVDDKNIIDQIHLVNWISDLAKICRVFISLGNHDFYYNHKPESSYDKELFNKIDYLKDVYVLDNQVHSEYGINFIGVTIPNFYYDNGEEEEELIRFMNKRYPYLSRGYNIMLIHSPYSISDKNVFKKIRCHKKIDLVLSGHMHGGLTFNFLKKLFKGRGIISPQKGIFKKYCYGRYKIDKANIIISSGVVKLSKSHKLGIFDFLYDSEVTIIDI